MKKIILIILSFFSLLKVNAMTYDTETDNATDISYYIETIERLQKDNKQLNSALDVYIKEVTVRRAEKVMLQQELDAYKVMYQENQNNLEQLTQEKLNILEQLEQYELLVEEKNIELENLINFKNEITEINLHTEEELENYKCILEEKDFQLQKQEDEKYSLLKQLENTNYLVDKKNLEIKELIDYQDEYTVNIVNDLNNCNEEKKFLKQEKKILTEEKEVKQGSLYYILVIVILSVVLTVCRIMSPKKNN